MRRVRDRVERKERPPVDGGKESEFPPVFRSCYNCLHSVWDPMMWMATLNSFWPVRPLCAAQPDCQGQVREVPLAEICRNWRPKPAPPPAGEPVQRSGGECQIHLTRGLVALVDPEDYEWLSQYTWHAKCSEGRFYAATVIDGKPISMHRLIMQPPPGWSVDHQDNNPMNNHRYNLRLVTHAQNRYNTRPSRKVRPDGRPKSSQYIGVSRYGDKWRAKITHDGHRYILGIFSDEIVAALVRDAKAKELHGEYVWLNFPEGPPPGYEDWDERARKERRRPPGWQSPPADGGQKAEGGR